MRVLAAALLLALALAAPAGAEPLLARADADELAQELAEAREATGVCFGWQATVHAFDGSSGGRDAGSDLGVGTVPVCPRSLTVVVDITYTPESSEASDAADVSVVSRGFPPAGAGTLRELAGVSDGDLLGDRDDQALFNLTAALPLLAAELDPSLAGRLPALDERGGAPPDAELRGSPGSDWWRNHRWPFLLALALLAAAGWLALTRPERNA